MNATRLSDLIGKRVVESGGGKKLGRAWDVRVTRATKERPLGRERWVVDALVISRAGALERFGFIDLRRNSPPGTWLSPRSVIPWDRVERVGPKEIVVTPESG